MTWRNCNSYGSNVSSSLRRALTFLFTENKGRGLVAKAVVAIAVWYRNVLRVVMGKDMFVDSESNGIDGLVQSVLEVNSEPRGY